MRPITLILPLAASLAVSACAATPPVAGEPTGRCDVAAAKAYIGQNASPAVVEQARKAAGAEVVRFERLAVGEGIEKVKEDYAAEVAKAMQV